MRINIYYPPGHAPEAWSLRYERGEVPDRWLYGLHRLRELTGAVVTATEVPPLGWTGRALAVARTMPRQVQPGTKLDSTIDFAWDEIRAARMPWSKDSVRVCGAIWCIDEQLRDPWNPRNQVTKRILQSMDAVWCLTRAQAALLAQWLGATAPRVYTLPFGIDAEFYRRAPYPESKPLILSLGTDRDRDGRTLARTLEIVLKEYPNASAIVQCSPEISLPDRVERVERLSHVAIRELYARAHAVLIPTRPNVHFSGMTVTLEGMAVGRPVIATNTLGADEYVMHGENGYLCPPGDAQKFADAAIEMLRCPDVAARIGESAADWVRLNHTTDLMNQNLSRIIEETTGAIRMGQESASSGVGDRNP